MRQTFSVAAHEVYIKTFKSKTYEKNVTQLKRDNTRTHSALSYVKAYLIKSAKQLRADRRLKIYITLMMKLLLSEQINKVIKKDLIQGSNILSYTR